MEEKTRRWIMLAVVCVSFLSAALLLVRHYMLPAPAPKLTDAQMKALGSVKVDAFDPRNLPPKGDMTDEEYAREIMRLRDEADKQSDVKPGSGLLPVHH